MPLPVAGQWPTTRVIADRARPGFTGSKWNPVAYLNAHTRQTSQRSATMWVDEMHGESGSTGVLHDTCMELASPVFTVDILASNRLRQRKEWWLLGLLRQDVTAEHDMDTLRAIDELGDAQIGDDAHEAVCVTPGKAVVALQQAQH